MSATERGGSLFPAPLHVGGAEWGGDAEEHLEEGRKLGGGRWSREIGQDVHLPFCFGLAPGTWGTQKEAHGVVQRHLEEVWMRDPGEAGNNGSRKLHVFSAFAPPIPDLPGPSASFLRFLPEGAFDM